MLLSAQERGEPIERILGKDVRQFCDEIIDSSQLKRFTWSKAINQLSFFILCMSLLWGLEMIHNLIRYLTREVPFSMSYAFTLPTLLKYVSCYLFLLILLDYLGKHVMSTRKTIRSRLIFASFFIVNLALMVSFSLWVPAYVLLSANIFVIALFFAASYFACMWLKRSF